MNFTARAGAKTSPFAHLLSGLTGPRAKTRRAEDRDDREDDGDEEASVEDRDEQEGDEQGRRSKKAKKAKASEDREEQDTEDQEDEGDEEASGEDDDEEGRRSKKGKKSKKAKASEDEECEEEQDEDEEKASAARAGRAFERSRCDAIFSARAAGARPDLAAHLAFRTGVSAKTAVGLLNAAAEGGTAQTPRAARPRLSLTDAGGAEKPTGAKALAAQIIEAGKKRRGEI